MPSKSSNLQARKLQAQELQARKFQSRKLRAHKLQELHAQESKKSEKLALGDKQRPPDVDPRFRVIDTAMKRTDDSPDALIEVLHKAQETFGYLEKDVLQYITRRMKLPLSRVYGVATFYHLFSLKPQGEHNCVVCLGTACYVKGGDKILAELEKFLEIKTGETTPDDKISLLTARCMGACGIAPAVSLDGKVAGKQTPASILEAVKELIASGEAEKIKKKVEELSQTEQLEQAYA
jgi:bidirectional [NiFe] hydrogenase diaphorase subunit